MKRVKRVISGWLLPLALCFAAVSVMLFEDTIGAIDGRIWPVVSPAYSIIARPVLGGVELAADADKFRDCGWRKTVFYIGARGGANALLTPDPHRDAPKVNGVGALHWDRIFLPIAPDRVGETYADAFHQCPWRPWQTISRFYN